MTGYCGEALPARRAPCRANAASVCGEHAACSICMLATCLSGRRLSADSGPRDTRRMENASISQATSRDGTTIAFERFGEGRPVIVVGGALCDRPVTRPLAEGLASQF